MEPASPSPTVATDESPNMVSLAIGTTVEEMNRRIALARLSRRLAMALDEGWLPEIGQLEAGKTKAVFWATHEVLIMRSNRDVEIGRALTERIGRRFLRALEVADDDGGFTGVAFLKDATGVEVALFAYLGKSEADVLELREDAGAFCEEKGFNIPQPPTLEEERDSGRKVYHFDRLS